MSWSFTVICSRLTGNWPGKLLALKSCWTGAKHFTEQLTTEPGTLVIIREQGTGQASSLPCRAAGRGLSTSPSNWPRSPELWSSSMTCKRPTPAWWVLGSCTGPIIMTRPSFIWSRMFLTKTPATGPSAWMLLTSSCSRTPGTCPRSPTWTSKYTLAVMACWQPPITRPHPPGPTATWWLTSTSQHPRNFACATPCFLMRTFRRHSPMDPPLRPEKRGVIAEEGPPPSLAMGPRSARPGTSATRLWSPVRRRPRRPAGRPGRRHQGGEDGFYRTSVTTSTQSSTWAAAGGLAPRHQRWTARRRHSKGPLRVGTVSGPLPTASAASHGPDQDADVAWRSWSYCPAPDGRPARRRVVMRARTRTKVHKSRPVSDGAWPSPLCRKSAGWHGPGGTWKARPRPYCPRLCEPGPWHCWGRLRGGGYISWRPDTLGLIVDGIEHKSTNLVDLAGYVVRQRKPGIAGARTGSEPPRCFVTDIRICWRLDGSRALTVSQSETSHC